VAFDTRLLTGVGVLAAITETGNFARAAEILGVTPSAVSRAIARLEARVGVRLFDRGPREVSLTEEGSRFYARVVPLLDAMEEAAAEAAGAAAVARGRLRVSVDPWFARMLLASKIQDFLARHPLVSLDLLTSNHREEMMAGVDVAIRFGPPDAASLVVRKLLETPVLTVAAPDYLSRRGVPHTPQDLVNHDVLLFRDPQTGLPFPWEFQQGGETIEVKLTSRLVLDDPSAGVASCLAGQGIFQSLGLGLAPYLARGELVQLLPDWSEELYALYAYHPSRHLPPAKVRAFLDFVQDVARAAEGPK